MVKVLVGKSVAADVLLPPNNSYRISQPGSQEALPSYPFPEQNFLWERIWFLQCGHLFVHIVYPLSRKPESIKLMCLSAYCIFMVQHQKMWNKPRAVTSISLSIQLLLEQQGSTGFIGRAGMVWSNSSLFQNEWCLPVTLSMTATVCSPPRLSQTQDPELAEHRPHQVKFATSSAPIVCYTSHPRQHHEGTAIQTQQVVAQDSNWLPTASFLSYLAHLNNIFFCQPWYSSLHTSS